INTWLDGWIAESKAGQNTLLSVHSDLLLSGSGSEVVDFLASEPFDEVEIRFTNLFMVSLGTTQLHELAIYDFCEAEGECDSTYWLMQPDFPVYINMERTGSVGLACVADINGLNNILSAETTDYAIVDIDAGVGYGASIAVRDALFDYPPVT